MSRLGTLAFLLRVIDAREEVFVAVASNYIELGLVGVTLAG